MYLVTSQVGSVGKADCVAGDSQVIFCEARKSKEQFIVDGHPVCRLSCTMERRKSMWSTLYS